LMGTISTAGGHVLTAMGNDAVWESDIKDSIEVLMGIPYISGAFVIPGVGDVVFDSWDTHAGVTTDGGEAVMIQAGPGQWHFAVSAPAIMPPLASTPDPVSSYPGTFSIITIQPVCTST
jgi:hypothetical protein